MNARRLDEQFGRVGRTARLVGAAGLALSALGWFFAPRQFFASYLFAFVFWLGLPLGSLTVLMMHYLTGGGWGYPIRRFLEASIGTLALLAGLFVPLVFGLGYLYPWANPDVALHNEALQKVRLYLNTPMFLTRAVLYFGCWLALAHFLARWGREQDETVDPAPTRRLRTLSGPGLAALTLTASLAMVDWVMVTELRWYSTVFPVSLLVGMILLTFAFSTAMLAWTVGPAPFERAANPLSGAVRVEHFHSLGNFLLAFVMMWAYLAVSQLIIIWSGNEPREITWYLHRTAGGWRYVGIFLTLFYFGLPFCLLLSRENKRSVRFLRALAVGVCAVSALERYWQILPSFHPAGLGVSWLDFTAFCGIGGVWLSAFLARLRTRLTLPQNDPRMEPALAHGH